MKRGVWKKGKKLLRGWYSYNWGADRFCIVLERRDPVTGQERRILVGGDEPEWNGWKLLEKEHPAVEKWKEEARP
jgi:hypothetical protein